MNENNIYEMEYLRAFYFDRVPKYVPSKVRMKKTVRPESLAGFDRSNFWCDVGEFFTVESNRWGAISAVNLKGQKLGLKPGEFDFVEWQLNPHYVETKIK